MNRTEALLVFIAVFVLLLAASLAHASPQSDAEAAIAIASSRPPLPPAPPIPTPPSGPCRCTDLFDCTCSPESCTCPNCAAMRAAVAKKAVTPSDEPQKPQDQSGDAIVEFLPGHYCHARDVRAMLDIYSRGAPAGSIRTEPAPAVQPQGYQQPGPGYSSPAMFYGGYGPMSGGGCST